MDIRQHRFEIYGHFGRVIRTFYVPDNETHHRTYDEAYKTFIQYRKLGYKVWFRGRGYARSN